VRVCCNDIATHLGSVLQVTNFKDITGAKFQDCCYACEKVMTGRGTDGSPTWTDLLAGFAACIGVAPNNPTWLTLLKLLFQMAARGI
jgi:hypothetical protein